MNNQMQVKKPESVVLVGNPNVGKSLIFNELTGFRNKIANFPGITVDLSQGSYTYDERIIKVIDLPGLYGFNSIKNDERIARDYLLEHNNNLIVNVVDTRNIRRGLFLTLQMLGLKRDMILVLTFRDKIDDNLIDISKLSELLGIPVLLLSSHNKLDITELRNSIEVQVSDEFKSNDFSFKHEKLTQILKEIGLTGLPQNSHNIALPWLVQSTIMGVSSIEFMERRVLEILTNHGWDRNDLALELVIAYYKSVEKICSKVILGPVNGKSSSSKIDRVLLHPQLGFIIFGLVMWLTFKLTFDLSEYPSLWIEKLVGTISLSIHQSIDNELLASFLADAIVGGVGFILIFIPQIAILFFFISLLEHSGYLSRIIFITDRLLSKLRISGTSLASLLLGFGCNVPAIMATKSIRDNNERIAVSIVNPFMSCSARLPVYVIIAGAIFGKQAGLVITSLYFSGIAIAVLVLFILRRTILKGETTTILMELPDLALPPIKLTLQQMINQVRKFVENAASWMAVGLIVMWVLSITGPDGYVGPSALSDPILLEMTWIYTIGHTFEFLFAPLGWDSRLIIALILGFIAKEVVISAFGLIYGVGTASISTVIVTQFTLPSALAYLFFVLLYTPCIGTVSAMRQEVGKRWTAFSIIMSLLIAYTVATIVYHLSSLIWGI